MFQMQYLLPKGFPAADGRFDREASLLGASLKGVDIKGAYVPNSALWLKLDVMLDGASLDIKKRDQLIYINLWIAQRPTIGTWIHSIPVGHRLLRENEVQLCQKLTVTFFWAVFAQRMKRQNPLN